MPQEESGFAKSTSPGDKVDQKVELIESDHSSLLPEVVKAELSSAPAKSVNSDRAANNNPENDRLTGLVRWQPRSQSAAMWWLGILLAIPLFFLSARGDSYQFLSALFLVSAYWSFCIYRNFAVLDSANAAPIRPWRAALFSLGVSPSGIAGLMLLLDLAVAYSTQVALSACRFLRGGWLFDVVSAVIFLAGIFLMVLPFVLAYRWYFIVAKSVLLIGREKDQETTRLPSLLVGAALASAIAGPNLVELLLFMATRHDYSTTLPMNYLYGFGIMLAFVIAMMVQRRKNEKT